MGQSKIKDIQLNSQNLLVAQDVRKSTVSSIVIVMTPSHDELQWLPPSHAQDINLHFSYILLTYTTYKHQFLVIPPFPSPWRNYIGKVALNSLSIRLSLLPLLCLTPRCTVIYLWGSTHRRGHHPDLFQLHFSSEFWRSENGQDCSPHGKPCNS